MEVFLCTFSDYESLGVSPQLAEHRHAIAQQVIDWWHDQPDFDVKVLEGDVYGKRFQRRRRMLADEQATGDFILTDDDLIPDEPVNGIKLLDTFSKYDDFGVLSFRPPGIVRWTEHDWAQYDNHVMEQRDVGGIRLMRKGLIDEWPSMDAEYPGYDRLHCEALSNLGWRVGYLRKFLCSHLCEGRENSTVWPVVQ